MKQEELAAILEDHEKWLKGEGGKRANLECADLAGINLQGVNLERACLFKVKLQYANLSHANLKHTNLACANLRDTTLRGAALNDARLMDAILDYANLENAILYNADLRRAVLRSANLSYASLINTDLRQADLRRAKLKNAILKNAYLYDTVLEGADLRGAKNVPFIPMVCPDEGEFIGWKKAFNGLNEVIVKLMVTGKRSSATRRKCRCDKAVVLAIESLGGSPAYEEATSSYDKKFIYRVGETVTPERPFCEDRWDECASGIHFFINRQEAVEYNL